MSILVTICGRGGSKGVPGKNILPLGGKPLIGYSIKMAQRFIEAFGEGEIQLSTDSDEIKEVARGFGLNTDYTRQNYLAGDKVGKIDVIADAHRYAETKYHKNFEFVLDLDITSPIRTLADLTEAFEMLRSNPEALNIFSVNNASRNPYFNMVEEDSSGFVKLVKSLDSPLLTRQSAPNVYDMNASFYIFKRAFFTQKCKSALTPASLAYVMGHICFDIDHPQDYEIMECLVRNNIIEIEF